MGFSKEEKELDCILAREDYIKTGQVMSQPGPTPELIRAVGSPTNDARSAEGMAPQEGSNRELQVREGPYLGPSPCFSPTPK